MDYFMDYLGLHIIGEEMIVWGFLYTLYIPMLSMNNISKNDFLLNFNAMDCKKIQNINDPDLPSRA
jgi:hypothetical protein